MGISASAGKSGAEKFNGELLQRRGRRPLALADATPIEQYEGYLLRWQRRTRSTYTRYLDGLRFLERTSGKGFLSDLSIRLTPQDVVDAIISNTHYAPETCAIFVKAAKSWERAGGFLGWWTPNGVLDLSYSVPKSDPEPGLTPAQIREVWSLPRTSREWRVVALPLFAGPNVGDAERVGERNWLDDRIRYSRQKTGIKVEVPLHPQLAALRPVILNDCAIAPGALKMTAKRLAERSSFHWTVNALRRTFAQTLLDADVPVATVKALMGHSQREVLFTDYAVVPYRHLVEGMAVLHYDL